MCCHTHQGPAFYSRDLPFRHSFPSSLRKPGTVRREGRSSAGPRRRVPLRRAGSMSGPFGSRVALLSAHAVRTFHRRLREGVNSCGPRSGRGPCLGRGPAGGLGRRPPEPRKRFKGWPRSYGSPVGVVRRGCLCKGCDRRLRAAHTAPGPPDLSYTDPGAPPGPSSLPGGCVGGRLARRRSGQGRRAGAEQVSRVVSAKWPPGPSFTGGRRRGG